MQHKYLKFSFTISLLLVAILFSGCDKLKDLLKANVLIDFEVPIQFSAHPNVGPLENQTIFFTVNVDSFIKKENNQLNKSYVQSATIQELKIFIEENDQNENNNLSNLENIQLQLQSNNNIRWEFLGEKQAPLLPFENYINFEEQKNFNSYFQSTEFNLQVSAVANQPIQEPFKAKLKAKLLLKVAVD